MSYLELKSPLEADSINYSSNTVNINARRCLLRRNKISGATYLSLTMAASDVIAYIVAFLIVQVLTGAVWSNLSFNSELIASGGNLFTQPIAIFCYLNLTIFAYGGLYKPDGWGLQEFQRIVVGTAVTAIFALLLVHSPVGKNSWAAAALVMAFLLFAVLAIGLRMCLRGLPRVMRLMTSHVIVVGSHSALSTFIAQSESSRSSPVRPLMQLEFDDIRLDNEDGAPTDLAQMAYLLAEEHGLAVDEVQILLAPSADEMAEAEALIARLDATPWQVLVLHPINGMARKGVRVCQNIGSDMFVTEASPMTISLTMQIIKRLFDFVMSALLLVVFAPFLGMISALLLFEKGPVFYVQKRVGHGGSRFDCIKFRSMRPDAQEVLEDLLENDPEARTEWEKYQKLANDPRVTWIGRILRKTSLDELPQLYNVLRGDMSLVGPRPIIAPEINGYLGDRNYYKDASFLYYTHCKPGITGLWQVSGRAATVHDERVRLDRWYARNYSIWLDLCILFQTVRVVITGKGSG